MTKKYVVIQGVKGGVGCTTVTANLAITIQNAGFNCIVVDACEQNDLRLHFGGSFSESEGLFSHLLENKPWFTSCYQDSSGVFFFPFGMLSRENNRCNKSLPDKEPGYLTELMDQIVFASDKTIVLIAVPCHDDRHNHMLEHVDMHLLVTNTDVASYAQLMTREQLLLQDTTQVVLNHYNPSHELKSDIHTLMHTQLPCAVAGTISQNEMIHEALAQRSNLMNIAANNKTAHEFHALAMKTCKALFDPVSEEQTMQNMKQAEEYQTPSNVERE